MGGELAKHILIGNIYRPPRTLLNEIEGFIEELTLIVQGLDKKTPNVLLAGDYNLNLLKVNELRTHSKFLDLLMSNIHGRASDGNQVKKKKSKTDTFKAMLEVAIPASP